MNTKYEALILLYDHMMEDIAYAEAQEKYYTQVSPAAAALKMYYKGRADALSSALNILKILAPVA